jgi:hypothetical protein
MDVSTSGGRDNGQTGTEGGLVLSEVANELSENLRMAQTTPRAP